MGKIALATLRVLNDRVYHYSAWQYEVSTTLICRLCYFSITFSNALRNEQINETQEETGVSHAFSFSLLKGCI